MNSAKTYYESQALLSEYVLFHYGRAPQVLPYAFGPRAALSFHRRLCQWLRKNFVPHRYQRVLDLGCAVGRMSFELSPFAREVIGLDYSQTFIRVAKKLQQSGQYTCFCPVEGKRTKRITVKLSAHYRRDRISFEQADAQSLSPKLGQFDLVLLLNLIDRLENPQKCLADIQRFLKPAGLLVVASPYTWDASFTPPAHWLGGASPGATTKAVMKKILKPQFQHLKSCDMPFLIREHARKFQWSVSEINVWRKR